MKKLYIKFEEGSKESLKLACEEAERLGYVLDDTSDALDFEGYWVLLLSEDWVDYHTSLISEEKLIWDGYSEYILPLGFKRGEKVWVKNDESKKWDERIFLTEIEGAHKPFVCVNYYDEDEFNEGEKFSILEYRFCNSVIKPKAKKKMTIAEIENLLGCEILISKE